MANGNNNVINDEDAETADFETINVAILRQISRRVNVIKGWVVFLGILFLISLVWGLLGTCIMLSAIKGAAP